ncbi:LysR family transcriptional regulator [Glaciibacter sp. 2TAF33]|uniref:LysR family transcriptional regulator n=1 Tax=Glaciibacter sp. 2TAF33 TaxID=3233015 RepID=UPI003F8FA381
MDNARLRHFIAVAEELNLGRAAKKVTLTPSVLGASVTKLETELGVQLIDRTTHDFVLTEAGAAFLVEARATLAGTARPGRAFAPQAGGKAKASKGKGRAPAVKGQPKVGKRRQSR